MRPFCSYRRNLSVQGEVVRWVSFTNDGALVRATPATPVLHFLFPFPLPFQLFFQWMPTKLESSIIGQYRGILIAIVPPCGQANTATLKLNIPLYCPPRHAISTHAPTDERI